MCLKLFRELIKPDGNNICKIALAQKLFFMYIETVQVIIFFERVAYVKVFFCIIDDY